MPAGPIQRTAPAAAPRSALGPAPPDAASRIPQTSAAQLERLRAALERSFRQPSAARPVQLPNVATMLRRLAAVSPGLLAPLLLGRLSTSGAELWVAKLLQKVPGDVSERQWQMAGAAFDRWNRGWRAPVTWTPEQVGRSVREAARLHERLAAGAITPQAFDAAMAALVRQVGAAGRSAGGAAPGAPTRPALTRPAPSPSKPGPVAEPGVQRGSQAVQALGRAIRAYGAAPGPATRTEMNHALALARSLHAREGDRWTPATRADFAVYGPQAARVLAGAAPAARPAPALPPLGGARRPPPAVGLPEPGRPAKDRDLREVNDQSGESRQARELGRQQQAREQADVLLEQERRRVKLRPETDTERADRAAAIADPTVRRLLEAGQSPRDPQRRDAGGARAGAATGGAGSSGGAARLVSAMNGRVYETLREHFSPSTDAGRANLGELLATRDGRWMLSTALPLPGASATLPPMPVTIELTRIPGGVFVSAYLDPARNIQALTQSRPYFTQLGEPVRSFRLDTPLAMQEGRIKLPGPSDPDPWRLVDPWGEGGLPNATRNIGFPPNFFDPELSADRLDRQLPVERAGRDNSWVPSAAQRALLRNLFDHRAELQSLLQPRYASHAEALGRLVETLREMERRTPGMFPAEMNFQIFPTTSAGTLWGIGLGAIGNERSVDNLFVGSGLAGGALPEPAITSLHTHPTRARSAVEALSGPSLTDLAVALEWGRSIAVYDNGVAVRIRIDDAWFQLPEEQRRTIVDELFALVKRFDALAMRFNVLLKEARPDASVARSAILRERDRLVDESRQRIAELPVHFDVIPPNAHPRRTAGVLSNTGIDLASPAQIHGR